MKHYCPFCLARCSCSSCRLNLMKRRSWKRSRNIENERRTHVTLNDVLITFLANFLFIIFSHFLLFDNACMILISRGRLSPLNYAFAGNFVLPRIPPLLMIFLRELSGNLVSRGNALIRGFALGIFPKAESLIRTSTGSWLWSRKGNGKFNATTVAFNLINHTCDVFLYRKFIYVLRCFFVDLLVILLVNLLVFFARIILFH